MQYESLPCPERDNIRDLDGLTIKQLTALRATIGERLRTIEDPVLVNARAKLSDMNAEELREQFNEITKLRHDKQRLPFNGYPIFSTILDLYWSITPLYLES
jgi:hypothetical protein